MNKKQIFKRGIVRKVLLNPGPATTSDSVKLAQLVPDICPREKEFQNVFASIQLDLLKIVNANNNKYATVLFTGSGTICIDVLVSSLLPRESKILIINNGSYSQRAVDVADYYGIDAIILKYEDNELPNLTDVRKALAENPDIAIVYATHHETGTGLLNHIREIGKVAHQYNKIFIVDTTSSFAMIPIDIEKDNIDFLMSSSQKGIMAMAGIAFVIGNKEIIEKSRNYPKRSYYCNLFRQYDYFEKTHQMHFTPPVQTIYSVRQALDELFAETLEKKYARHRKAFEELYTGLRELGFNFYVDIDKSAKLLISILYPNDSNWSFDDLHDYCYEKGYTIYPGKVINKPSFRLSVYGTIDVKDIRNFMRVFKKGLEMQNVRLPLSDKDMR